LECRSESLAVTSQF